MVSFLPVYSLLPAIIWQACIGLLNMLGIWLAHTAKHKLQHKISQTIPWFAVAFIGVVGFNSLHLLPSILINSINQADTFLLTLAMAALGIETNLTKVKKIGLKPFYFSVFLFCWLMGGGYLLSKMIFN